MHIIDKTLLVILFYFRSVNAFADEQVHLAVGETYLAELPAISKSVDLDDVSVVSVRKLENKLRLMFRGLKSGKAVATVQLSNGAAVTYHFAVGDRVRALEEALAQIDGLTFKRDGGRVVVTGTLAHKEALLRLQELKRTYGSVLLDSTDKSIASHNSIIKTINRILKENDLENFEANAYGRFVVLEGSPKSEAQADLALRIARTIYPSIENRVSSDANGAPAVSIEVLFVETSKVDERELGFQSNFGANEANSEGAIAKLGVDARHGSSRHGKLGLNWQVGGLLNFLKLIQTRKSSRIMSNPKLVARSGTEAKFHAGETIYITQKRVVKDEVVVEFVPVDVGILLHITPRLDDIGQIDTKVQTEVSEMADVSTDKMPTVSRSKVHTAVTIRDGQTIMLSGLLRKKNRKTVERVPLLGDIPIVGELFKSRVFHEAAAEMLVLVTMNRIRAYDEQAKAAGQMLWERAAADIEFRIND